MSTTFQGWFGNAVGFKIIDVIYAVEIINYEENQ